MRDIVVFSGSSNKGLADLICENLGLMPGDIELKKFANGETSVRLCDSVREKDVYIIQSGSGEVNDNFMELLLTISACKMASAKRITVVCPLFFYSRQAESPTSKRGVPHLSGANGRSSLESVPTTPKLGARGRHSATPSVTSPLLGQPPESVVKKPYKSWVAQSGSLIANLITSAGANHIVTMDLHDPQFQGLFDIPVDNLFSKPFVERYIVDHIRNYKDCVIVSPDAGGAKRAAAVADTLGLQFALIHKERRQAVTERPISAISMRGDEDPLTNASVGNATVQSENSVNERFVATTMLVGDVQNRVCVILDDLVDTATTVLRAARLLKEQGAVYVYVIITHGIFSGDGLNKVKNAAYIDEVVTTNTVDQGAHVKEYGQKNGHGLTVLDVSKLFAEAIRRINNGESISLIYDQY